MKKGVMKKTVVVIIGLILLFLGPGWLAGWLQLENNRITVASLDLYDRRLPADFDGFRIAHISDLHSQTFGANQADLMIHLKEWQPDIVVMTGDMVDARRYDPAPVYRLAEHAVRVAPVYFATGNHDFSSGRFPALEAGLAGRGVRVLRDRHEILRRGQSRIIVAGIDDPAASGKAADYTREALEGTRSRDFVILLAHRPEWFEQYASSGVNLVLAGHAHGGQVRLPGIGGLYAPGQGFFPRYTAGKYEQSATVMVVSRGLGNSVFPQRLFNRPEIILITLRRGQ